MFFRRRRRDEGGGETANDVGHADSVSPPNPPLPGATTPAPGSTSAEAHQTATSEAPHPTTSGWLSREPIIVGNPTLGFEPKAVSEEYRRVPYRPDTVLDGWSTDRFSIRGGSVRGYLHRYRGVPRQDDFAVTVRARGKQIIAAVADGVSEAAQSHIGSTTAVRYACQWLDGMLGESADGADWKSMIESTAWALVEQARSIDPNCTDAERAEQMLATTLVCAVVETHDDEGLVAHVINIGDSGAWCLNQTGYTRVEGGKAESSGGISSSAVSGLPRIPQDVRAARIVLSEGDVLLLGTDGFGDPLGSGDGLVGKLFLEVLLPGPPSLTEFGHALDFSRETFDDDRTLVAIWPGKASRLPPNVDNS